MFYIATFDIYVHPIGPRGKLDPLKISWLLLCYKLQSLVHLLCISSSLNTQH